MERHCENARSVAEFLNEQSSVDWVRYPGMNDGQASMVEKYLGGKGGAMVVFGIKGGKEARQKRGYRGRASGASARLWCDSC